MLTSSVIERSSEDFFEDDMFFAEAQPLFDAILPHNQSTWENLNTFDPVLPEKKLLYEVLGRAFDDLLGEDFDNKYSAMRWFESVDFSSKTHFTYNFIAQALDLSQAYKDFIKSKISSVRKNGQ